MAGNGRYIRSGELSSRQRPGGSNRARHRFEGLIMGGTHQNLPGHDHCNGLVWPQNNVRT